MHKLTMKCQQEQPTLSSVLQQQLEHVCQQLAKQEKALEAATKRLEQVQVKDELKETKARSPRK